MLGVGLPWQLAERDEGYYTRTRHAFGWPLFHNWKYDCLGMDGYLPMLWRVEHGPAMTAAIALAQRMRGHTWLMGNEPERPQQANTPPALFADAIRTWLALVGRPWAGPGILWGDGGRAWLDEYIRIGGPMPDVWAIHIYGSDTLKSWNMQYDHALSWLAKRGRNLPVWVTETNLRSGVENNAALMRHLHSRSDVTAYWYCSHASPDDANHVANLHGADGRLTPLGQVFRELQSVRAARKEHNFYLPFLPG